MNLKYDTTDTGNENSRSYSIINEGNEFIGTVEGYVNVDGELITVVRINPDFQKQGLGYEAFHKVFNELDAQIKIKKIVGSWHKDEEFDDCEEGMSTNLKLFLECIKNEEPNKCAFRTPTGRWAIKLGFKNCKIISKSGESASIQFIK